MAADTVDKIIAYECGELSDRGTLELFGALIKSGAAWTLQGHYGRTAAALIDRGLIDKAGVINWALFDELSGA